MHTEGFTIFSLDLNFARCLVICPLLLLESISPCCIFVCMCVVSVCKHHGPTINILYCRPVYGILGFTRKKIVALTMNIESRVEKKTVQWYQTPC